MRARGQAPEVLFVPGGQIHARTDKAVHVWREDRGPARTHRHVDNQRHDGDFRRTDRRLARHRGVIRYGCGEGGH